jgi:hypothetical protein
MMQIYTPPPIWDAGKFAVRYGLNKDKDFYVNGEGKLVVFSVLPDNPPIFELSDPPQPRLHLDGKVATDLIAKLDLAINPPIGPQIDARVKAVLIELRKLI